LLSLARSHQRQQCGNFKDPGLQAYGRGSVLFQTSRDEIDKTFDDLPPPIPKRTSSSSSSGGALASMAMGSHRLRAQACFVQSSAPPGAATTSRAFKMSSYNSKQAPCFTGSSLIELITGEMTRVSSLRPGDYVATPRVGARVAGIVKTVVKGNPLDLCTLGDGLEITPWHPVCVDGRWTFPANLVPPTPTQCDAVYSIILENEGDAGAAGHGVFIGGILCVTMGHGVQTVGDVRAHPFLSGHDVVMQALSELPGEDIKEAVGIKRDATTGLMCGFVAKPGTVAPLVHLPTCGVEMVQPPENKFQKAILGV